MFEVYDGYDSEGHEIHCVIDQEKSRAEVEYEGEKYMRFQFNPDFPQDARDFFKALCNIKKIIIDE
jgi:heme-binding NEAT domain protein